MKKALLSIIALAMIVATCLPADARRGETCWRTNRHTHHHFRIC